MSNKIINTYIKAFSKLNATTLNELKEGLEKISSSMSNKRFSTYMQSPTVSKNEKKESLKAILNTESKTTLNMANLLIEKKRVQFVSQILAELNRLEKEKAGNYDGVIYSDAKLEPASIEKFSNAFSKKLNKNIAFTNQLAEQNSIKATVDSMGIEVSFSKQKFDQQLIQHILKNI